MITGQQLVKALDNSEGIVMITDADGNIDFINKSFERIYGFSKKEVLGKKPSLLRSGFHAKAHYDELWKTISGGNTWNGEFVNRTKSGEVVNLRASISPLLNDDNSIYGYIAVQYNISERTKLKEQLDIREQLFEKLFENSPVGIFILENEKSNGEIVDFKITRANLRSSRIFNRISFIDQKLSSVLKKENISGLMRKNSTQHQGDEMWEWYDVINGKDLEFKLFNLDRDQKCLMISDVTNKVKMESRLKESEAHLRELNETKDKIFSIISHDLKSPFQAIIGFVSMLNNDLDSYSVQEIKKMASQISEVSQKTYKLLDDLLTWSKSQLGQLSPRPTRIEVHEIVDKAVGYLTPQAEKKDIKLVNAVEEGVFVKADPDMLNFVIRNLCHNGVKYTLPGGKVRCYISRNEDKLFINVEDTGIGIQEAKQKEIFSLSGNISSTSGTSEEAGTGLGLMLSQEMTELNGGTISLESSPGKGSCFSIIMDEEK